MSEYMEIPLGKSGYSAKVDIADYEKLKDYPWRLFNSRGKLYAIRKNAAKRTTLMHREILVIEQKGYEIDHINCDGLDNRRINLRAVTHQQNSYNKAYKNNSSGYKGVKKNKDRWIVTIVADKVLYHYGRFIDPREAAEVYDMAAIKHHGEFAKTNKMLGLL